MWNRHSMSTLGSLHLIPVPIQEHYQPEDLLNVLPQRTLIAARSITHFVVENAKSARQALKAIHHPVAIQSIAISELPVRKGSEPLNEGELMLLMAPLLSGQSIGVMSESGCPGMADPGAELAAWAHQHGAQVVSHVGPSSMLLALMASGLQGQRFSFNGYLPVQTEDRIQALRHLEMRSAKENMTQLFIETPYRNEVMLNTLLHTLHDHTQLTIASHLTAEGERLRTQSIAQWKSAPFIIERVPTVFALLAEAIVTPARSAPIKRHQGKSRSGAKKQPTANRNKNG
jgi:16S rRNA (cytidine1402-2'-O)-methyltransferase